MSRVRDDRGAVTVLAALLIAVQIAVMLGGVTIGSVLVARHRAQSIADLASLAAAQRLPAGPAAACREAATLAGTMGGAVLRCTAEHLDVTVVVSVGVGGRAGAHARATARAGPAGPR